jgi:hypothetical protein
MLMSSKVPGKEPESPPWAGPGKRYLMRYLPLNIRVIRPARRTLR